MSVFSKDKSKNFDSPAQLPADEQQSAEWLEQNRSWWEHNPMRYDWHESIGQELFSKGYFKEIDRRFFASSEFFLPSKKRPFDRLIPFDDLADKNVLEIGVGQGSHAQLLSLAAKHFTGIDLTDFATKASSERMRVFELKNTRILQMNAESLDFENDTFDFVWSWGVIHHSANTPKILKEVHRVLKPGGKFVCMVYHRGYWNYYFVGALAGFIKGRFFRGDSLHKVVQDHCDGAMARFYTPVEWERQLEDAGFSIEKISVMGMKTELLPIPASRIKNFLLSLPPNGLARFCTNNMRMGSLLISETRKES